MYYILYLLEKLKRKSWENYKQMIKSLILTFHTFSLIVCLDFSSLFISLSHYQRFDLIKKVSACKALEASQTKAGKRSWSNSKTKRIHFVNRLMNSQRGAVNFHKKDLYCSLLSVVVSTFHSFNTALIWRLFSLFFSRKASFDLQAEWNLWFYLRVKKCINMLLYTSHVYRCSERVNNGIDIVN